MSDLRCDEVKGLAPEVALDIATGEERDAVLRHISTCGECHRLLTELSSVGDGLLMALTPAVEPDPGFDTRVLEAFGTAEPAKPMRVRRRPWARFALAAGAAVVAMFVGGGVVYQATSADRILGQSYRATLELGRGSSFAAAPITGPEGRAGTVFAYQGDPSWVMVTFDTPPGEGSNYSFELATHDGGYLTLGEAVFEGGDRTWGEMLPVALSEIAGFRFVDADGNVVFTALVDADSRWD